MSDIDQIKNSNDESPSAGAPADHGNKAPIEGLSPATSPEPSSELPVASEAAEKIDTPVSNDTPSHPAPASTAGEDSAAQAPTDDRVVTPSSDEFLDQLLKGAQPATEPAPEHPTPNTEHSTANQLPPVPPADPVPATPAATEKPLELPATPLPPDPVASATGEEIPPPSHIASATGERSSSAQFPSDSEQIDLRGLNNELANKEAPSAQPKTSSAVWPIIIIVLIIGGALAVYFLVINKPKDLVSSPTGTNSDLLTPSATDTTVTPTTVAAGDTQRKTDLTNIQKALEQYYAANKKYPVSATESKTESADAALKILVPQYISSLPADPTTGQKSYLYKSADGSTYELSATFDAAPSGISKVEPVATGGYKVVLTPGDSFEVTANTTTSSASATPAPAVSSDSTTASL